MPAEWNEAGEPTNLAAAAADAGEWLALVDRLVTAGVWKFGQPESRMKLRRCREELAKQLAVCTEVA